MKSEQEAAPAETPAKSPDTNKVPFTERFTAALEGWRKEGCPVVVGEGTHKKACGAPPHRTKMEPKNAAGDIVMVIDCAAEHPDVWRFAVPEVEMKAELERQAKASREAEANGGKTMDPMKASLKITMDLRTQEVAIDPWVPTPGIGIQLAGILMSHFFAQMQASSKAGAKPRIVTPAKGIVHPVTGKPLAN